MKKKLAFIGAGSFSDGVLPWIDQEEYEFVGYFDDKDITEYRGYPVFSDTSNIITFLRDKIVDCVFITIGDNIKRKEIFEQIAEQYYDCLINIISQQANIFSEDSIKGRGIFVGFSSFIGMDSEIYDNCIINTGAIVEHHSLVHPHCNITPGTTINGLCTIGEGCYIGSGSIIIQNLRIAPYTVLGAGTVVVQPILESGTYVGVPAKKIK